MASSSARLNVLTAPPIRYLSLAFPAILLADFATLVFGGRKVF
jgi:hypothetical protein